MHRHGYKKNLPLACDPPDSSDLQHAILEPRPQGVPDGSRSKNATPHYTFCPSLRGTKRAAFHTAEKPSDWFANSVGPCNRPASFAEHWLVLLGCGGFSCLRQDPCGPILDDIHFSRLFWSIYMGVIQRCAHQSKTRSR